jgi:hypothetical protein
MYNAIVRTDERSRAGVTMAKPPAGPSGRAANPAEAPASLLRQRLSSGTSRGRLPFVELA